MMMKLKGGMKILCDEISNININGNDANTHWRQNAIKLSYNMTLIFYLILETYKCFLLCLINTSLTIKSI